MLVSRNDPTSINPTVILSFSSADGYISKLWFDVDNTNSGAFIAYAIASGLSVTSEPGTDIRITHITALFANPTATKSGEDFATNLRDTFLSGLSR